MLRLWVTAVAQPLDYTRCNTQNCWHSVDAHFQKAAVTISRSHLHRTAANMLIMDICRSRAPGIYMMQHPKALTLCWQSVNTVLMLCWRSVDAVLTVCWRSFWGVTVLPNMILPVNAANTSIMDKCRSTALGLYKMLYTKFLTLCWRSLSDRCCDHVTIPFAQNGCQYVDYGHMP